MILETVSTNAEPVTERNPLRRPTPMRFFDLYPPFDRYMNPPPEKVLATPSMMSENELTFLYNIVQKYYVGAGRIVDAGIFLGGSTLAFAEGVRRNSRFERIVSKRPKPILSLERAIVTQTMPAFFKRHNIGKQYKSGDSFAELLKEIVAPSLDLVELRIGDIIERGDINDRIEILFLDVLKNPAIAEYAIKQYFPKLIPGRSIVIQQDYFFDGLPFIKTYQEFFSSHFEYVGEVGSSGIFRCVSKVDQAAVREVSAGLPARQQIHLASIALQRSNDPIRRLMMAMSKTLLILELEGVEAARAYLTFVEGEFSGEIRGGALPHRLAEPLEALRARCGADTDRRGAELSKGELIAGARKVGTRRGTRSSST